MDGKKTYIYKKLFSALENVQKYEQGLKVSKSFNENEPKSLTFHIGDETRKVISIESEQVKKYEIEYEFQIIFSQKFSIQKESDYWQILEASRIQENIESCLKSFTKTQFTYANGLTDVNEYELIIRDLVIETVRTTYPEKDNQVMGIFFDGKILAMQINQV